MNNKMQLNDTDTEHIKTLTIQIAEGFEAWRSSIDDWSEKNPDLDKIDYRRLMPQELKHSLINIQRIKPEVFALVGIDAAELVRSDLELLINLDFLNHQIDEELVEDENYRKPNFMQWFKQETNWEPELLIDVGTCGRFDCDMCIHLSIPAMRSTLVPISEGFALETATPLFGDFSHLYR